MKGPRKILYSLYNNLTSLQARFLYCYPQESCSIWYNKDHCNTCAETHMAFNDHQHLLLYCEQQPTLCLACYCNQLTVLVGKI